MDDRTDRSTTDSATDRTAAGDPWSTLAVAVAAGAAGVAGSYAAAGATPAFVAAPVEALLSRAMPGVVVTAAITVLGDLGQQLNLALSVALSVALLAAVALPASLVGRELGVRFVGPALATVGVWVGVALLTAAPVAALGAAVPVGVVLATVELAGRRESDDAGPDPGRRSALGALAGALGLGVLAAVVGTARTPDGQGGGDERFALSLAARIETDRLLAEAAEKSLDVDGLEPLVSTDFYSVDINAVDPTVNVDDWTLTVTGAVEREVELSYDDVVAMPSERQFVSLRCVGDALNGRKMDSALWEVVPVAALLDRAGVESEGCCVMLRAADGYYEEFPLAALRRSYLAYGMNGAALPRAHGYPVRALVPGHWGEINVKWLTEIEVLDEPVDGYWEERGWHGTGPVNTVAKLWVDESLGGDRRRVAGHAYAGTRGVSRVEVSTDGGATWNDARLSDPLPGEDVWRQWSYEYEHAGSHEVVVRAVEADGTVQPRDETDAFPSGASGWVRRRIEP